MKKNKRGISDVVTTVLIIMLTLIAVGVIAGVVVPFVREGLQKSTECMDYKEVYTFDESFDLNCKSEGLYKFSIKANGDGDLIEKVSGIKIIVRREDETTETMDILNGKISEGIIMSNEETILILPGPSGVKSYYYTSQGEFVSAEVYPVLENGRICADVIESIKIVPCGS